MEIRNNITAGKVGNHREWELETSFDSDEIAQWLTENIHIGLGCGFLYVTLVFAGQKYMEKQPRYNLRQPMMIWSLFLAIFSIFGTIRCSIVLLHILMEEGFRGLICSHRFYVGPITRFWGPVFVFSKLFEYVDTAFIILRKQKLLFLHWYHHLTVSLFSWSCYGSHSAGGGIFMTVNFIVHAMMYSYYAVKAAGYKIPRPIAVTITASQIIQMVIGCLSIYYAALFRNDGNCRCTNEHILYGSIIYGSYLLLFMNFFYNTYIRHPRAKKETKLTPSADKKVLETEENLSAQNAALVQNGTKSGYQLRERKREN